MDRIASHDGEGKSQDITLCNVARLRALFPEAVAENKVDFDVLHALLGGKVTDGSEEKYGLTWKGKRRALQLALTQSTATLRPVKDDSVYWDTSRNLMIEGDNLEVLKLLQKSYASKVKLIYIDPPYNTGKDFVYPDDFRDTIKNYQMLTGQIDGDGRKLTSNPEASGRYHTDWLNMMIPRLKLARNLLSDDGVIALSINDIELDKVNMLLGEIFGEENFLSLVSIVSATTASYRSINACPVNVSEYLLVYAKSDAVKVNPVYTPTDYSEDYSHLITNFDERSERWELKTLDEIVYENDGVSNWREYRDKYGVGWKTLRFQQKKEIAFREKHRVVSLNTLQKPSAMIRDAVEKSRKDRNRVHTVWREGASPVHIYNGRTFAFFGAKFRKIDGVSLPCEVLTNVWTDISYLSLGKEGDVPFVSGKKPLKLVRRLLDLYTEPGSTVLDFFAGSGTSGHAIMEQNATDGGQRRFILVQLPEPLDPTNREQKVAAEYCDSIGKPRSISELTKERLRLAAAECGADVSSDEGDFGFRVFTLAGSNIRAWDPYTDNLEQSLLDHIDPILPDRTNDDVLYELLLKQGLDLSTSIDTRLIHGKTVNAVGDGTLFVCLAEEISRADADPLALGLVDWHREIHPARAYTPHFATCIFRDSAFTDDVAKENLSEILKRHGLNNVRSL